MEQKCIEYLRDTLLNWSEIDVRTVPGVMYQIICRKNKTDDNTEYRFHWFLDCAETYVHNHQFTFDTYCLEGEYTENLWDIIDDGSDAITHVFQRTPGNTIELFKAVPGVLVKIGHRDHFQRNILHVETNQYHSISPKGQSNDLVITFVARKICSSASEHSYILSPSDKIEAPIEKIRQATLNERENVYIKLQQNFPRIFIQFTMSILQK